MDSSQPSLDIVLSGIHDVMEAVQELADQLDQVELRLDSKIDKLSGEMKQLTTEVDGIKGQMNTLVTKDHLDDRLADLRADLVLLARKEDKKLATLIQELVQEGRLNQKAADKIMAMEPFPVPLQ